MGQRAESGRRGHTGGGGSQAVCVAWQGRVCSVWAQAGGAGGQPLLQGPHLCAVSRAGQWADGWQVGRTGMPVCGRACRQQLCLPLESQCCRSRSCESISCKLTRSMLAAWARFLSTAACVCLPLPSGCIQVVAENSGDSWSIHRPTELKPGIFAPQLYTNRWDGRAGCESFSGLVGMCA